MRALLVVWALPDGQNVSIASPSCQEAKLKNATGSSSVDPRVEVRHGFCNVTCRLWSLVGSIPSHESQELSPPEVSPRIEPSHKNLHACLPKELKGR